ncbi:MAG: MarR family winged helix-turn-helix transcriptional regulator [Thermoplasmata archaeon]|nr:MarR family winged helix-turn-helix transcriptional regulator [Thermoplasmata archaeon]
MVPNPRSSSSDAARPGTQQDLLDAFHGATVGIRAVLAETVRPMGLAVCQFWALNYIVERGPVNGVHIADELAVTPPSITVAVDDLVDAGLVVRNRSSEDRRVVLVSATPQGRKTLTEIWRELGSRMAERTSRLPASDLEAAARVLRAIGPRTLGPVVLAAPGGAA